MEPLDTSRASPRSNAGSRVAAIVPVINEAEAIGGVVAGLLAHGADVVVVVDGASNDGTVEVALTAGAVVITETRRGYGRAMSAGLASLPDDIDIVLFFDGDGSDDPARVPDILRPVRDDEADLVMGNRLEGPREPGSLGVAQVVAGTMAGLLLGLVYGVRCRDMSPFRAIRLGTLKSLGMKEPSFGWNLEMQMRAAAAGLRVVELAVGQRRRRGGVSKVSGSPLTAVRAAFVIGKTFLRLAVGLRRERSLPARPRGLHRATHER